MSFRSLGGAAVPFALVFVVGWAERAEASRPFPARVEKHWQVSRLPVSGSQGCLLCHASEPGVMGTATQKFAITLKSYGLVSGDVDSLDAALDQAKLAASDSDGDGFTDYSEIVNDVTDPSDAKSHRAIVMPPPKPDGGEGGVLGSGGAAGTPDEATGGALPECIPTKTIYPTLSYGCAFAPSDDTHGLAELGVVAMLGLARRRRRHSNHE